MFNVGAMKGRLLAVLLVSSVCLVSGCGKPVGDVAGKVTYKGKPLEYGSVSLASADGTMCGAEINPDGTYLVKSVPVGKAKVSVTALDPKKSEQAKEWAKRMREGAGRQGGEREKPPVDPKTLNTVPGSYGEPETSGLTVEVKAGMNQNNIDLK
jgi:hypothetical protein